MTQITPLTEREQDVLRLLAAGSSDREIADELVLTVGTVKWYNRQIYNKLNVSNRTEAATCALEHDLLNAAQADIVPKSPTRIPGYVPAQLTSFIGRQQEIETLTQLLDRGQRLITLTGPPGVGKTRLTQEFVMKVRDRYQHGVYFVPLAPVHNPDLIPNTIAAILQVKETGMDSPLSALFDYLRDKKTLLILDNYEHLLQAAATVSDFLKVVPTLTVIVTSREALRLYGEYEFPVSPLGIPDLKQAMTVKSISGFESVDLLIQRTQAIVSGFVLEDDNAAAIATICVHLDGLPLAIELAAARMRFYAPQTLLVRLASRLEALKDGPRDLPDRQRTLRATLAWSYELLEKDEQVLFARLGIFVGGCTVDAIEAICSTELVSSIADCLESLCLKNLIQLEPLPNGERRFMMLETMREYALEKLEEQNERTLLRDLHLQYFRQKAAEAEKAAYRPEATEWYNWLESEHDNLRAAITTSLELDESGELSFELIASLSRFWYVKGYFSEARSWLMEAMKSSNSEQRTRNQADAFYGISFSTHLQGDNLFGRRLCEDALSIYQELEERSRAAQTLVRLGEIVASSGDFATALELSQQAYELAVELDDHSLKGNALCQLGFEHMRHGNYEKARQLLFQALEIYQSYDAFSLALVYAGLGEVEIRTGHLKKAIVYLNDSLRIREEIGDKWGIAAVLGSLGWIALIRQEYGQAISLIHQSLRIRYELSEIGGFAWCLEKLAEIRLLQGEMEQATCILGAAFSIRERGGSAIDLCDQAHHKQLINQLQIELGNNAFEMAWSEGQAMTVEQAIEFI